MTLEEANAAALLASMSGDLEALGIALRERGEAIRELLGSAPSEELISRVRNAIGAGEFVDRDLRGVKGRVAVLRSALATECVTDPAVDLHG